MIALIGIVVLVSCIMGLIKAKSSPLRIVFGVIAAAVVVGYFGMAIKLAMDKSSSPAAYRTGLSV